MKCSFCEEKAVEFILVPKSYSPMVFPFSKRCEFHSGSIIDPEFLITEEEAMAYEVLEE
jgi:hypothetical protein